MTASRAGLPILAFGTSAELEGWFEAQPPAASGMWLKLAKKGTSLASVSMDDAVDAALCHGWIDGQSNAYDAQWWLVRFTPRRARSKWSQINRDRVARLIAAKRMRPSGLAEVERAKADGRWDAAYAPPSRMTVPDDLRAALDADPGAAAAFEMIDGRNRYAILHRIQDVKTAKTRADRIAKYVALLALGGTVHPKAAKDPARR